MYGDTTIIRGLATALRERADDIRREADRLAARADAVHWEGLAADAMRHHAHDRAADLRHTAGLHDDAADALDRHAREVDRLKDLIAAIEQRVHRLVEGARDRLADLGHRVIDGITGLLPDPADELLDRFVPPPPGSRDWLSVDLPGLG
jgi:hypothetical protein